MCQFSRQDQSHAQKPKEVKSSLFGPFQRGPKGIVEKSPLIKHVPKKQDEFQRRQSIDKTATNSDNQAFLKDVSNILLHIGCKIYFTPYI